MDKLDKSTIRRFHLQENGVLYPSDNGMICYYMDVAKLQAINARLLEALEEIMNQTDGRNNSVMGQERAYSIARAAIAKAKGEQQ